MKGIIIHSEGKNGAHLEAVPLPWNIWDTITQTRTFGRLPLFYTFRFLSSLQKHQCFQYRCTKDPSALLYFLRFSLDCSFSYSALFSMALTRPCWDVHYPRSLSRWFVAIKPRPRQRLSASSFRSGFDHPGDDSELQAVKPESVLLCERRFWFFFFSSIVGRCGRARFALHVCWPWKNSQTRQEAVYFCVTFILHILR